MNVARSLDELEVLAEVWARLCRESARATPFQSEAWILPWIRHMNPEELVVLTIREGQDLVGITPLFRWGPPSSKTLSPLGAGISDYLDVVAAPGFERPVLEATTDWLEREQSSWRVCRFDELGTRAIALDMSPPRGRRRSALPQSVCPVLTLRARVDGCETAIPERKRTKLDKDRRRAAKMGGFVFERRDGDGWEATLELLFALHARRWASRGEPGVLADSSVQAFHREVAARLHRREALRLYSAHIGGQAAAVIYGFRGAARLYLYILGIEPSLSRVSPGSLALAGVVDDAFDEGVLEVDFLRGSERYKYDWGAVDEVNVCLTIE